MPVGAFVVSIWSPFTLNAFCPAFRAVSVHRHRLLLWLCQCFFVSHACPLAFNIFSVPKNLVFARPLKTPIALSATEFFKRFIFRTQNPMSSSLSAGKPLYSFGFGSFIYAQPSHSAYMGITSSFSMGPFFVSMTDPMRMYRFFSSPFALVYVPATTVTSLSSAIFFFH